MANSRILSIVKYNMINRGYGKMHNPETKKVIHVSNSGSTRKLALIADEDKRTLRATVEVLIEQEWERRHPEAVEAKTGVQE